ncbi:MAG: histidine--tRNA ligase [Elusimicrobiota bacterium]
MSSSQIKAPKGTRDLVGVEGSWFSILEQTARNVFGRYEFTELRTPIFEQAELFSRSLGATSDVVEKEMFTFVDRGERTFSLRPEGTAGVVRHYIENSLGSQGGVHRFFYMGPMFRAERPQAGRYRQFWQIGSEYFGASDASADAETIAMINTLLKEFGVTDFSIQINSIGCKNCRSIYRVELLKYLESKKDILSEESIRRMTSNPLRVLDSKLDGPKLIDAPIMKAFLCASCKTHDEDVHGFLKSLDIPFEENPKLVRGLDYYTKTVFEFVSSRLGAQSAVAAGGRYDELVAELGGPATPAVGFALGMDRVVSIKMTSDHVQEPGKSRKCVVVPLLEAAGTLCVQVSHELRKLGMSVSPVQTKKKLKNQLSQAVDNGAKWAILIGEDELKANQLAVKNLETREQTLIPRNQIKEFFKNE